MSCGMPPRSRETRENDTIVCLSSTRWDFLWQRPQQLMSRLSQSYGVLYVDPPLPMGYKQIDHEMEDGGQISRRLTQMDPDLFVYTPLCISRDSLPDTDPRILDEMNTRVLREQLGQVLARLNWLRPLLWIYNPQARLMIEQLGERGVVYDCVDNFASFSWSSPETARWDAEITAAADVVLTSSLTLYQERAHHNDATYLVPNAADYDHFCRSGDIADSPPELSHITHPRLGFIGAVYEWLDFEVLEAMAAARPAWQIVLIGPKQHGLTIPDQPNLHWLGTREYTMLPWYLQGFSLMLIPFQRTKVTECTNPIKLWEYLAAGKPIVTKTLPEIPDLPGVIWPSDGPDEFIANCADVLEILHNPEEAEQIASAAQAYARPNSWENRCQEIRRILKAHFEM